MRRKLVLNSHLARQPLAIARYAIQESFLPNDLFLLSCPASSN